MISNDDRNNALVNIARGRDACGVSHDELVEMIVGEWRDTARQARELLDELSALLDEGHHDDETGLLSIDGVTSDLIESVNECVDQLDRLLAKGEG